ncbi:MAG TPA: tRNA pseudouridine(55) synthase TruB [Acidimicrobiia bacterium]|nr:tRNA pseudouridine(55) synthase TruB [Acidimicrobiia bacterium]
MSTGFLVIDKPGGMTSNAVVSRVKRATGIKKVGHAGTLDPLATGVVVVAVGPVTRLIRFIQEQPKEYQATAQFGVSTDTLDADGAVLSREPMEFSPEELEAVAARFVGTLLQVPPMVSALKHEGRRLYEMARQGEVVEREARPVEIHELEIEAVGSGPYPEVEFRVVCGKGTYVRSLADDMAAALGGCAHLTALRRTRTGSLDVDTHGLTVDQLGDWESHLLTPADALGDLPAVTVSEETARGVGHGMRFVGGELAAAPEESAVRVLDPSGDLIAVYRREGEQARPEVVLAS